MCANVERPSRVSVRVPEVVSSSFIAKTKQSSICAIKSELVYDSGTSLGHPPFCKRRVSPSSERLHNQMRLHRFDIISLSVVCLGTIICDINTIGFVSVYAHRVCDTLIASCATVHYAKECLGSYTLALIKCCYEWCNLSNYFKQLAEQQPVGRWARTRKYETPRTMKTIGNCA